MQTSLSREAARPGLRRAACVAEKPSVLALVTEAFGGKGGIAQFNRDFLRALDRTASARKIVVMPRLGDVPSLPDHPLLQQRPSRFNRFHYSLGAIGNALAERPDLVLSGHVYHGPLACYLARMTGARLVSVLHGTEIWTRPNSRHLKPLLRSDLVICVSRDTRDRFLAQLDGRRHERVAVLPNTVEDRFCPGDREAARAKFGLDHRPVILTVGRLDPRDGYKGHDRVLPVIARLKAEGRAARYLIAGDGPDGPRLQALARRLDVADLVEFLGYVPDEEMPDLYRAADAFALPSTGEGFGIVYLEAMACGTPAIGLSIGGACEALGSVGVAVPEAEFEEALVAMLSAGRPDPEAISAAVRSGFGRPAFESRVQRLMREVLSE